MTLAVKRAIINCKNIDIHIIIRKTALNINLSISIMKINDKEFYSILVFTFFFLNGQSQETISS